MEGAFLVGRGLRISCDSIESLQIVKLNPSTGRIPHQSLSRSFIDRINRPQLASHRIYRITSHQSQLHRITFSLNGPCQTHFTLDWMEMIGVPFFWIVLLLLRISGEAREPLLEL